MNEDPTVKPAWMSTEFWLTVLPVILLMFKALTGKDTSGIDLAGLAALAAAVMTAGYGISRSIQKRAVIVAKSIMQQQKLALEHDTKMQFAAREHEAAMSREVVPATLMQGPDLAGKLDEILTRLPAKKAPAKRVRR